MNRERWEFVLAYGAFALTYVLLFWSRVRRPPDAQRRTAHEGTRVVFLADARRRRAASVTPSGKHAQRRAS